MRIKQDDVGRVVYFVAVDATDLYTRETSLTNTAVWYDIDGDGQNSMTTPTITHIANGVYKLAIDEAGMVTLAAGVDEASLVLHITADEMADVTMVVDVFRAKITAGRTLGTDASGALSVCTSNTDMVGTNGANTVTPDIAGTAATLHGVTDGKIDAVQSDATTIKNKTDGLNFTGDDIKATLDGETVTTDAASRIASRADVTNLDVPVSSRNAVTPNTIAPDNEGIAAIETQTDKLDGMIVAGVYTAAAMVNCPTAEMDPTELAAAMKAITGLTVGGTWTWEKIMKITTAFIGGNWRVKETDTTKQELMDAEDGTTIILEQAITRSPAAGSNYRNITVKI